MMARTATSLVLRPNYDNAGRLELQEPGVKKGRMTVVKHRPDPELPVAGGGTLVVKVEGEHYWSGRGQQGYAPAHFEVWQYDRREARANDAGIVYRVEFYGCTQLLEFPCRPESVHLADFPASDFDR